MTHVTYDRSALRLEMEGHADAGPPGSDPVCAALSMLMLRVRTIIPASHFFIFFIIISRFHLCLCLSILLRQYDSDPCSYVFS